ncbi:hypothetical protein MKX03_024680 [Papaver bracteatum]|nr:hypothetical protein MKX03_024680 [Papaver bracteatum]
MMLHVLLRQEIELSRERHVGDLQQKNMLSRITFFRLEMSPVVNLNLTDCKWRGMGMSPKCFRSIGKQERGR